MPGAAAVTFTPTAQLLLALIVPPVKVRLVAPAVGANVPPQVLVTPGVPATCRPAGNVSVMPTPVRETVFELVKVRLRTDVPPALMVVGANALLTEGGLNGVRTAEVSA